MLEITIKKSFLKQILETIKQQKYILTSGLSEDAITDEQKEIDRIYNEGIDLVNTFEEAVNQLSAEKEGAEGTDEQEKSVDQDVDGKLPTEGTGSELVLEKDNAPVEPANVGGQITGTVETKVDTDENKERQIPEDFSVGAKVAVISRDFSVGVILDNKNPQEIMIDLQNGEPFVYATLEDLAAPADEATKEALNEVDNEAQHQQDLADEAAANQGNQ